VFFVRNASQEASVLCYAKIKYLGIILTNLENIERVIIREILGNLM
jgi:hypothetical protein